MRLLILLALLSGCAEGLTTAMLTTNAMISCDVAGTMYASNNGAWNRQVDDTHVAREMNPLLGPTPSLSTLANVWAATTVLNTTMRLLPIPTWAKWTWYVAVAAAEGYVIRDNNRISYCGASR